MSLIKLSIGQPFFDVSIVENEQEWHVAERTIVLNLGPSCVHVAQQKIEPLQSCILSNVPLRGVEKAVLIEGFENFEDEIALSDSIKSQWPSAFEKRGEERLRGVEHYMSPKVWVGKTGFTIYHSASVPLNVGLHKEHPFCDVAGYREVHTQLVGVGKMQQCREQDIATLYLEETMAPGITHRPMYDEHGNYPWHQFETTTPSTFLAVEMLPAGAAIPEE